jgi:hypothetical protein
MSRFIKVREAALACGIALSLSLQAGSSLAFSPEPAAPNANKQAAPAPFAQQQPALPGQQPQVQLNDPLATRGENKGTEVKIPGVGVVGTLPKLDFGLELLYGPKNPTEGLQLDQRSFDQRGQESDMQIKGTLTHKF